MNVKPLSFQGDAWANILCTVDTLTDALKINRLDRPQQRTHRQHASAARLHDCASTPAQAGVRNAPTGLAQIFKTARS
jgi:hypothetical protein